jgi:hypothetical protein
MPTDVPSTAGLTPDPIALCSHINRLNRELRLARRLLRVTIDARQKSATDKTARVPAAEGRVDAAAR